MSVELFDTYCVSDILEDRFPVAAVSPGRIWLRCPASSMVAADWLCRQGVDAQATLTPGGWAIDVESGAR